MDIFKKKTWEKIISDGNLKVIGLGVNWDYTWEFSFFTFGFLDLER